MIWVAAGGLALAGALVAWRSGALRGVSWRAVAVQEALFGGAFAALVVVRLLNPDLWQPWFGGEKLMESAYFQAVARSETMPPYDPYFAGGRLNYYYLGLFQANIPLKLVGLRPEIAFNLAVPTLFALTASHAFWAGRQLWGEADRRLNWRGGAMAATLVALAGNLTSGVQLVEQVSALSERGWVCWDRSAAGWRAWLAGPDCRPLTIGGAPRASSPTPSTSSPFLASCSPICIPI